MSSSEGSADDLLTGTLLAMEPMPAGYRDLLARVAEHVRHDERVRAVWVGGSVARGVADAGSDLDLLLAVADDHFTGFDAGLRAWLSGLADLVLAAPLRGLPGSLVATTAECLRVDVVAEPVGVVASTAYRHRRPVLDKDGLDAAVPAPEEGSGPDAAKMLAVVEEFYRQQAIFPAAVVAREDWLLGVVGVQTTQQLLYHLFVACNEPLPPMGVKQWSSRLTEHQRAVLAGLPAPTARRDSVVATMLATRSAFVREGQNAVAPHGLTWPADLHDAVAAYWAREGLLDAGRNGLLEV